MDKCTPANRGLPAIRDVCELLPSDIENFGVDDGGPLPLHDSDGVDVPFTSTTLTSEQVEELMSIIVPRHVNDDDVGIDAFLREGFCFVCHATTIINIKFCNNLIMISATEIPRILVQCVN